MVQGETRRLIWGRRQRSIRHEDNEKVPGFFSRRISPTKSSAKQGRVEFLTAAVERGPSQGARSGSKESSARPCTTPSKLARSLFRDGG